MLFSGVTQMSSRKVARREFLKTGSAAALGLTVFAVSPGRIFASEPDGRGMAPLLGVGYASSVPEPGGAVRLIPADYALAGDPTFISRGARVAIRSSSRAVREHRQRGGVAIDVTHPAFGYAPEKYPRFRAWSYLKDENDVDNVAGPIAFTVPVTATQGLQLVVRRVSINPDEPASEAPLSLTLGSASGEMKLQRGLYVVAFREGPGDSIPSWSSHSVSSEGGQLVVNTTMFSYAVLTVDFADQP